MSNGEVTITGCSFCVKSVTIPEFYSCSDLKHVNIPKTVTKIYDYTFSGCCKLAHTEIPSSVTSIGNYAFDFCTSLTSISLPDMYGKNLTFKTGGVDGCDCEETLKLIAEGKLDTEPLITHTYPLSNIDEAYELFENKRDGVIKVAVEC